VINKGLSEVGQGLKVMSTGVNYIDELVQRRHGGSMDDQVAEDSCANKTLFGCGLAFKVDASVIRTGGIGMKANTLQVFDGGEGRHQVSEVLLA
jgi:hypothetical protein